MRFMMIVKADERSEAGALPSEQELAAMLKFNEELVRSGKMLAGEGLHPSSRGARVSFSGGKPTVVDGPFAEAKELIAGFWLIEAESRDAVIELAKRVPFVDGEIEIRQIFADEEFAPSDPSGELRAAEARLREQIAARATS